MHWHDPSRIFVVASASPHRWGPPRSSTVALFTENITVNTMPGLAGVSGCGASSHASRWHRSRCFPRSGQRTRVHALPTSYATAMLRRNCGAVDIDMVGSTGRHIVRHTRKFTRRPDGRTRCGLPRPTLRNTSDCTYTSSLGQTRVRACWHLCRTMSRTGWHTHHRHHHQLRRHRQTPNADANSAPAIVLAKA